MRDITSTQTLTLEQPPSCIAFCPQRPEYFVVGTYLLLKLEAGCDDREVPELGGDATYTDNGEVIPQRRSGTLLTYKLRDDVIRLTNSLELQSAILDLQWCPHLTKSDNLLCAATSTGSLLLCRLDDESSRLETLQTLQIFDQSVLILSVCWHPTKANTLGVTLSNGEVCLITIGPEEHLQRNEQSRVTTVHQHELEAWTLAFSATEEHILSGGDDARLRCSKIDTNDGALTLWQDRRTHGAGVTAVLPLVGSLIVTGSYDDRIRLLDAPTAGQRQVLAEENLGGGVWRLELVDSYSSDSFSYVVLASCMHAGPQVLKLSRASSGDWSFLIIAKFEEHQSMNYGSNVQPCTGSVKRVVSTSFYDRLLCLWKFDLDDLEAMR